MQTTLSSREFNQDTGKAKRAAHDGPVFITDRGRPSHVLMTVEAYQKLTGNGISLADALAHSESTDLDFDIPRLRNMGFKPVEFD